MQEVANFIGDIAPKWSRNERINVKVAIIGDGVDLIDSTQNLQVSGGISFVPQHHAWYFSSTGHGTEMATLIRRVCPFSNLYVARLNVDDPTTERNAAQVRQIHSDPNILRF
jgi:hypothetical protein